MTRLLTSPLCSPFASLCKATSVIAKPNGGCRHLFPAGAVMGAVPYVTGLSEGQPVASSYFLAQIPFVKYPPTAELVRPEYLLLIKLINL